MRSSSSMFASSSCLLALVARAHAVSDGPWGGYGLPTGGLEVDASEKQWKDGVEASNASSVFPMPGRDVSKAWPGAAIDGWEFSLTAVDLTPAEVGYDLRITAPESLYKKDSGHNDDSGKSATEKHGNGKIVDVDDDWVLCSWLNFGPPYDDASRALNPKNLDAKPDGDCGPWLSEACINGLEEQARTAYSMSPAPQPPYGARVSCGDIMVPKACEGSGLVYLNGAFGTPDLPIRFLTGPTTYQGGWTIRNGQDTPLKDAPQMWNSLTRDYMAVITMFGRYAEGDDGQVEPGFAKMSCIRPEVEASSAKHSNSSDSSDPGSKGSDDSGSGDSGSGDSAPADPDSGSSDTDDSGTKDPSSEDSSSDDSGTKDPGSDDSGSDGSGSDGSGSGDSESGNSDGGNSTPSNTGGSGSSEPTASDRTTSDKTSGSQASKTSDVSDDTANKTDGKDNEGGAASPTVYTRLLLSFAAAACWAGAM